jgi:proteasome assembly chaperone (PAC2) family protein
MSDAVRIWEHPQASEIYLLAGWRQWADAGSASSGLPQYLIQLTKAQKIGEILPSGFYIFQIPGTHDLLRPVVRYQKGVPETLETPHNELYYTGNKQRGLLIFLGDEPHLDIERYVAAFLHIAKTFKVRRIIGLGGVYGELPYDKERPVSASCSLPALRTELNDYAVDLSEYQGGASIGSYICHRAGNQDLEYVGLYTFVPLYNLADTENPGNILRIDNDFTAWLGLMRRIDYMLKLHLDLSDLEQRSQQLLQAMEEKIEALEQAAPQLGIRQYLQSLSDKFTETPFAPLDDVWEEEIRRLLDKFDEE